MMISIAHTSPRDEAKYIFLECLEAAFANSSRFINAMMRAFIWAAIWALLSLADGIKLLDSFVAPQPLSTLQALEETEAL